MQNSEGAYLLLFHSATDVPPPLAFRAMIRIGASEGKTKVEFSQAYIGREEIPPDEIEAEGFSMNDDFSWEGVLPLFWFGELEKLLAKSEWKPASETQVLLAQKDEDLWLSPVQESRWIVFCEELIQACLEEGGKELPMEMVLGELLKNNFYEQISLEWRFARKEIHALVKGGKQTSFAGRDWDEAEAQLKKWMEEEAAGKDLYLLPRFRGNYWLVNGEVWLPERKNLHGRLWEWVLQHQAR